MAAEAWDPLRRWVPSPHFFVSADSKVLNDPVSPLEATLTRCLASVDFKRFSGLHNHGHRFSRCAESQWPGWVAEILGLKTKKRQPGCRSPNGCVPEDRILQEE